MSDSSVDLEERMAHSERVIEELSEELRRQGAVIDRLLVELRRQRAQIADVEGSIAGPHEITKPPHY